MPAVWWLGGHLGAAVSALVDGQLDEESTERAWTHVAACPDCRRLVEREGWVKRRLVEMAGTDPAAPPEDLLGSLYGLRPHDDRGAAQEAWAAVEELERRARPRRRAGLAVAGVGSVSAAVLGLSTLGAAPLGIGGAPASSPASSLSRPTPVGSQAPSTAVPTRSGAERPGADASTSPSGPAGQSGRAGPSGPDGPWRMSTPGDGLSRIVSVRSVR